MSINDPRAAKNLYLKDKEISLSGIMADAQNLLKAAQPSLEEFEGIRITAEKDIPVNEPVILFGGKGVASRANITGVSAHVKSGKTAFVSVILAGAISETGEIYGFTGLDVEPNPDRLAVIDVDTEQAADDQQYKVKTILKRCDLEQTPDYFLSYNFRQLKKAGFIENLNKICAAAKEEFEGIHLISIDGGADFANSVNDDQEAAELVEYFTHLSIKYDCPVLLVVHLNPGSDKERGHLGSEIQRKCYGLITIERTGDISTAKVKVGRKAGMADTGLIHFQYDPEAGYHVQVDAPPDAITKKGLAMNARKEELAKQIFSPGETMAYADVVREIMKIGGKGERTAKRWISDMIALEVISKLDNGFYRLNDEEND